MFIRWSERSERTELTPCRRTSVFSQCSVPCFAPSLRFSDFMVKDLLTQRSKHCSNWMVKSTFVPLKSKEYLCTLKEYLCTLLCSLILLSAWYWTSCSTDATSDPSLFHCGGVPTHRKRTTVLDSAARWMSDVLLVVWSLCDYSGFYLMPMRPRLPCLTPDVPEEVFGSKPIPLNTVVEVSCFFQEARLVFTKLRSSQSNYGIEKRTEGKSVALAGRCSRPTAFFRWRSPFWTIFTDTIKARIFVQL